MAAADKPAGASPAAGAEKAFTYKEDRSSWVDPGTLKKSEHALNRVTHELNVLRSQLADRDKRLAALAGVVTPSADEAEAAKIAEAFYALPQFAHLKGITPELLQGVQRLLDEGQSIAEARDHVWNAHTDRFLAGLDEQFAIEMGVEALSDGQKRKLHAAFGALIPDERMEPDAYATFKRRFEQGDPKLIDEFIKEYTTDILEPVRRLATVSTLRRQPVPRSGPAAPVFSRQQKPDYSQMTVQQMLEQGEKDAEAMGR